MLATRLATGLTLVAVLIAVLILDERLAPWFPLWFAAALVVMVLCSLELVGLLALDQRPPFGEHGPGRDGRPGPGQLGAPRGGPASWATRRGRSRRPTTRRRPFDVMAWPLWTFVAILMATFLSQSLQFRRPGRTMATIAGTILAVAYVGLLGSFMIQMRWFDGPYHGLIPLAALVATAKGSDTGRTRWGGSPAAASSGLA